VPPHASAWLAGDASGSADGFARLAHRAMAALELEQTTGAGSLPLDPLGLFYAAASEVLTSQVPERRALSECVERESLGAWVCAFARSLDRSHEPLYRALGRVMCELHCADDGPGRHPDLDAHTGLRSG
jgi:TorA maturation chaperone TorD